MRRLLIAASLAAVGACADIGGPTPPPSGDVAWVASPAEMWLSIGREARVDSLLRLGFTQVLGDSRCPATVVCAWAGDGAAELAVGVGMGPSYPVTLHTLLDPRQVDFLGYQITLLELSPYPQTPGPIPADDYAVRLRVVRLTR